MFSLKRGDTFDYTIKLTDEAGAPLDLAAADVRSQIRTVSDKLIVELTITALPAPGQFRLSAPSTENWPITKSGSPALLMDIELNVNGRIRSSETMKIQVRKDVTRDERN